MRFVEQHIIDRNDPRYKLIDDAAFKSKNLYNAALYEMRQAFIFHGLYLSFSEMDKLMQLHEAYKALPAKVAQHVLKQLVDAWKAFSEAQASFLGLDPIPVYKPNDDTKYTFSGKRFGRRNRLYRTKDGKIICADVNGSYNILRKRKPDAFTAEGIAVYVVQPVRLAVSTGEIKQKVRRP